MANRVEFDIVSRFSEEGIDPLFNKVQARLEELSRVSYAGAPVAAQVGQAEVGAERSLQQLRGAGLIDPAQLATYRAQLRQIFNELPEDLVRKIGSSTRLTQQEIQRRAAQEVTTDVGVILPPGRARDQARQQRAGAARGASEDPEAQQSTAALAQARIDEARQANENRALENDLAREQTDYLESVVAVRTTTNQRIAAEEQALAEDRLYLESVAEAATSHRLLAAAEDEIRATNGDYLAATVLAAESRARLAANENLALAADRDYLTETVRAAASKNELAAAEAAAASGNQAYLESVGREAREKNELAAAEAQARTSTAADSEATRRLAEAKERAVTQFAYAVGLTDSDVRTLATGRFADEQAKQREEVELERLRGSQDAIEAEANLTVTQRERAAQERAITEQQLTGSEAFMTAEAESAEAMRERAQRLKLSALGVAPTDIADTETERAAQITAEQRVETARQRILVNEQLLGMESAELAVLATQLESEDALAILARDRVAQERLRSATSVGARDVRAGGLVGDPTMVQRMQAAMANRAGGVEKDPLEFQTGPQLMSGTLLTTARFALTGAVLFGAINGIRELVTNANELEKNLSQVRAEFDALGQSSQFAGFRNDLLSMARETGVNANEVVQLGQFMKGAFGDTQTAVDNTRAALEAMATTGLQGAEAINTLVAITKTFDITIAQVSDHALGLQDRFGVAAKEIIQGVATLGPVASEVGLDFRQTSDLIAAAAQVSGRQASAIAEAFNRILPQIQKSAVQIAAIVDSNPTTRDQLPTVEQDIGQGDYGKLIVDLTRLYPQLTQEQRLNLEATIGGRREAQALIDVWRNGTTFLKEYDSGLTDAGRTQTGFADLQQTLSQVMARLKEDFRQAGEALGRAGLTDALKDIGGAAEGVFHVLGGAARIFADLNDATHGWAGRLVEAAIALRILVALAQSDALLRIAGAVLPGIGAGVETGGLAAAVGAGGIGNALRGGLAGATAGGRFIRPTGTYEGPTMEGIAAPSEAAAGASAMSVPVIGMITVGALAVTSAYSQQRGNVQKAASSARDRLSHASDAYLQELIKQGHSTWDAFSFGLFGQATVDTMAREVLRSRQNAPVRDRINAAAQKDQFTGRSLLDSVTKQQMAGIQQDMEDAGRDPFSLFGNKGVPAHLSDKQLQDVMGKAAKGNKDAIDFLNRLNTALTSDVGEPAIDQALGAVKAAQDTKDQKDAVDQGKVFQAAQAAKQLYEAGVLSLGDYLKNLRANLKIYQDLAAQGPLNDTQQGEYAALLKQQSDLADKLDQDQIQLNQFLGKLSGVTAPQANMTAARIVLTDANASVDAKYKAAQDYLQAQYDNLQALADAAVTAQQRRDILQTGTAADPTARLAVISEELQNSSIYQDFRSKWVAGMTDYAKGFDSDVSAAVAAGKSVKDAETQALTNLQTKLQNLITTMRQHGENVDDLLKDLDNVNQALADVGNQPDASGQVPGATPWIKAPPQTPKDAIDQFNAATEATKNLARANANGNPLQQAQADLNAAQAEYDKLIAEGAPKDSDEAKNALATRNEAAQNLQRQADDAARANMELEKAMAGDDPVKLADIAVREANAAVTAARRGGTDPAKNAALAQALAQQVTALKQQRDAPLKAFRASIDLQIAMANAAGDTVTAANLELDYANRNLANVKADPLSSKQDIQAAQTEQITKAEQARHTALSAREADVDFQLQMKQITTAQAIAMYQAILDNADLIGKNEQDKRDLMLKIQSLKQGLSQDLTMGIPADIRLPTMYEVRRFRETPAGQGYNDNRQVNVVMNVNNGMDQAAATRWLSSVVGGAPRSVVTTRRA